MKIISALRLDFSLTHASDEVDFNSYPDQVEQVEHSDQKPDYKLFIFRSQMVAL